MSAPIRPGAPLASATPARAPRAELRRLSREMEAVFLQQLFRAMRESVPEGGLIERSAGEDAFTAMLDERLASEAAARSTRGLGEALYRQLARRLGPDAAEGAGP
jgi:flagellar protein FlgJ